MRHISFLTIIASIVLSGYAISAYFWLGRGLACLGAGQFICLFALYPLLLVTLLLGIVAFSTGIRGESSWALFSGGFHLLAFVFGALLAAVYRPVSAALGWSVSPDPLFIGLAIVVLSLMGMGSAILASRAKKTRRG